MKKLSNPLLPLAAVFAFLVLGLGVTVGVVVGVTFSGQGISADAIASGVGAMIGAMLTVGAAIVVFYFQERRAEQRRHDEIRPHALQLSQFVGDVLSDIAMLEMILEDGQDIEDTLVQLSPQNQKAISEVVSGLREKVKAAGVIPVPGTSGTIAEISKSVSELSFFELVSIPLGEKDEQGTVRVAVRRETVMAIAEARIALIALRRTCERYI